MGTPLGISGQNSFSRIVAGAVRVILYERYLKAGIKTLKGEKKSFNLRCHHREAHSPTNCNKQIPVTKKKRNSAFKESREAAQALPGSIVADHQPSAECSSESHWLAAAGSNQTAFVWMRGPSLAADFRHESSIELR